MSQPIVLVGLSGSGKSTVGPLLAASLKAPFTDTDSLIEEHAGRTISDIFAGEGEVVFRQLEHEALTKALAASAGVISTGGGIVEYLPNHDLLRQAIVIWLTGSPQVLAQRLAAFGDRPLLREDPQALLQRMAERRSHLYASVARHALQTDDLTPQQVVEAILRAVPQSSSAEVAPADQTLRVTTPGGSYSVIVAAGALQQLPEQLASIAPHGRCWVISDDALWPIHGDYLTNILTEAAIPFQSVLFPHGEESKNLGIVSTVYDQLLYGGVERGDVVLALGGGVVGDLAGFVAATVLRGITLIQLPTTILAMVDSSIGGKTGVDHPAGKNLIGSFYQPRLVLADTKLLATLPAAELIAGWAEAIKHGVILDPQLFGDLHSNADALRRLEEPVTSDLLRRSAAVKVGVVSGDEREHGDRILLNYGHTIAHALEHWSEYTMRHGEAVAIGMVVEARIAAAIGLCDAQMVERQNEVLTAFGLPTSVPADADPTALLAATRSDKKIQQKRVRWVLPIGIGSATVTSDVSDEVVLNAIRGSYEF